MFQDKTRVGNYKRNLNLKLKCKVKFKNRKCELRTINEIEILKYWNMWVENYAIEIKKLNFSIQIRYMI